MGGAHGAPQIIRRSGESQGVALGKDLTAPYVLSAVIAALMAAQAVLGRVLEGQYRDVAWIRATWFGNDLVTLLLAVPLLVTALVLVRRGSVRALILWLGVLGYSAYNYAYYMLGAALNAFFPLYVLLLVLSVVTLILVVSRVDASQVAAFRAQTPVRAIGGYLIFVAVGLSLVWFGMWAAYVFAGRPTPVEPEAFKLVAALDTSIMVSLMAFGGRAPVAPQRLGRHGGWHRGYPRLALPDRAVRQRRRRDQPWTRGGAWRAASVGRPGRRDRDCHRGVAQRPQGAGGRLTVVGRLSRPA